MASAQDWYARHLGTARQAPAAPVQEYQAPAQVLPWEQAGRQDPWQQLPPPVDTSKIPRGFVKAENFIEMAQYWRGGPGNKAAEHCPECDGVLFRRFNGRMEAAPMCTECGWNGLFSQGHQRG